MAYAVSLVAMLGGCSKPVTTIGPSAEIGAELETVSVAGTTLAYVDVGHGDAVVLVHGGLQDYRMWNVIVPHLAKRYRVIAYSRRNHHPNPVSRDGAPDNAAADVHGDDIAALTTALGLDRVDVVAHSSGAHAALFFAANHPQRVRALVLNEPPAAGMLRTAADGDAVLQAFMARFGPAMEAFRAGDVERALPLFADAVGGPGTYARRPEPVRLMMKDNAHSAEAEANATRRAVFTCDTAKRITSPALLTTGEHSPPFFHRIVDELERCLPNNERTSIAGASHSAPLEQPEAFASAVVAFLTKH